MVRRAAAERDAKQAREAELRPEIAAGRAGFRERYEAHQRQQAAEQQARALVGDWDRLLQGYNAALPGLEADPALDGTREQLLQFGRALREQPEAAQVLRERGAAFGMEERPNLARVLSAQQPERVIAGIMEGAEAGLRQELRVAAEQEATRKREVEAQRQRSSPSRGMSPGR